MFDFGQRFFVSGQSEQPTAGARNRFGPRMNDDARESFGLKNALACSKDSWDNSCPVGRGGEAIRFVNHGDETDANTQRSS